MGLGVAASGGRKTGRWLGRGDGSMGLGTVRVEEERIKSKGERVRLK